MRYDVASGDQRFCDLTAREALAKLRELVAAGADPCLYDGYGDAMGRVELERIVADD